MRFGRLTSYHNYDKLSETGGDIMKNIRPVSDLRNNFAEISKIVHENNEPVFLTKRIRRYGSFKYGSI